jgi:hypothetical protein
MAPMPWHPKSGDADSQRDAAEQLKSGCGKLAEAATEVRSHTDDEDPELAILAQEVIDVATRGLVVTARVGAPVPGEEGAPAEEETDAAERRAVEPATAVPAVVGLSLSEDTGKKWTAATVALLQQAVAPLTRAAEILTDGWRESADEVTTLREEVCDIAPRLAAADARIAAERS